ncbi:MAG TPA: hypothetical protein DDZ80_26385 [Cyanobacteria bacterium UBA8803]|nr:hypothetical protein [Cyanobacteria bacterium UBA9273]HBL61812.1 hypothetical protein [Cyanobacteria bacterium UBA8803]
MILGHCPPYVLYELIRPVGSLPIPIAFDEAQALFEQAKKFYGQEEYRQAGTVFMEVAQKLRLEKGQPYWEAFAANRIFAYENAVLAWMMNDALDRARRSLGKAAETDTLCADNIHHLLEQISS